jgi:hypothetical protein
MTHATRKKLGKACWDRRGKERRKGQQRKENFKGKKRKGNK